MLTKLDRYIIKKYLTTFVFTLGLFILIAIVIDISEKIDDFLEKGAPLKVIVMDYYLNFIPYFLVLFSPIFVFISVIFFTAKMASNTEIIAILSSGVSYARMLRPFFIAAGLVVALAIYLNAMVVPGCDLRRIEFESVYVNTPRSKLTTHIHSQVQPGIMVYVESFNFSDSTGYNFSVERFEGNELKSKLIANRVKWNNKTERWRLENFLIRSFDGMGREHIETGYRRDSVLPVMPAEFDKEYIEASTLNTPELTNLIETERAKGNPEVKKYLVEKRRRVAAPFAYFVLTLLAAGVSSRKVRGGIGLHLGIGIFISLSYMLVVQVCYTYGITGQVLPAIAVWSPNLVYFLLGLYIAYKAPK